MPVRKMKVDKGGHQKSKYFFTKICTKYKILIVSVQSVVAFSI